MARLAIHPVFMEADVTDPTPPQFIGILIDEGGFGINVLSPLGGMGAGGADNSGALKALGGNLYLFPAGTFAVAESTEVPAGAQLAFAQGALLQPAQGKVITLQSAPLAQGKIFDTSKGGSFASPLFPKVVQPQTQWWGVDWTGNKSIDSTAAFQAAIDFLVSANILELPVGVTYVTTLSLSPGTGMVGRGRDQTWIYGRTPADPENTSLINDGVSKPNGAKIILKDIQVWGSNIPYKAMVNLGSGVQWGTEGVVENLWLRGGLDPSQKGTVFPACGFMMNCNVGDITNISVYNAGVGVNLQGVVARMKGTTVAETTKCGMEVSGLIHHVDGLHVEAPTNGSVALRLSAQSTTVTQVSVSLGTDTNFDHLVEVNPSSKGSPTDIYSFRGVTVLAAKPNSGYTSTYRIDGINFGYTGQHEDPAFELNRDRLNQYRITEGKASSATTLPNRTLSVGQMHPSMVITADPSLLQDVTVCITAPPHVLGCKRFRVINDSSVNVWFQGISTTSKVTFLAGMPAVAMDPAAGFPVRPGGVFEVQFGQGSDTSVIASYVGGTSGLTALPSTGAWYQNEVVGLADGTVARCSATGAYGTGTVPQWAFVGGPYLLAQATASLQVNAGGFASTTVAVAGAQPGNRVLAALSGPLPDGVALTAQVTAAGTVGVSAFNLSGTAQTLSGTLTVQVFQ